VNGGPSLLPGEGPLEEAGVRVVVFHLGGELHACDVLRVEEVVEGVPVHALPDVPPPVLGVIRLRGTLLPVLDVAPALGLRLAAGTPAVLVVERAGDRVGVAVDEVREVATLPTSAIQTAPLREDEEHVTGVTRVGGALVSLLDLAQLIGETTNQTTRETP
jgi:purine-binding chemotaxis protein CheW